ncbi:hypothetical protein GLYMA_12G067902v4 [Glycine max]|uniref:yrdC domain-containing protein, mitochondrial isoform X2 n=1 Tax=Glycine max TaxID=3847 RepID=UPI00071932AE|nr:yrdC domain-containing protein, mitochondrial isoform X2 [Glycine max]XP_028193537.1 yrdC domain-containing protein, mitochondrial-like isoform X2 [Glycine soja]KAG4385309.1 hypothetical protein GLYMA_12G067902v4 [Glycine max]KAH1141963.1 hypothetical protein GYH30_032925 [Glycine max]|eukprot:XP_014620025.1 yrdC domain-containing protein, mitochondrial isoform X1 [Glycine max]
MFLRKDCLSSTLASLPISPSEVLFSHNRWFLRLSVFPPSQQCEGPRRGFSKNMSCSVSVDNSDMVHPATDAYAGEAVEALKAGSLEAVNRIYEIKGRRHTSPLAICVGDVSDIARFAVTDHLPHGLLDCLLPGPVIVVLKRGVKYS